MQGIAFLWLMNRAATAVGSSLTAAVTSDVSGVLESHGTIDLETFVRTRYPAPPRSFYAVMASGEVVYAGALRPEKRLVDIVRDYFQQTPHPISSIPASWQREPFYASTIVASGNVVGVVGLVPTTWVQAVGWRLLWVGLGLLILGTALASRFIFGPVHSRLRNLEAAALRLGAGDLSARARDDGGDEVASLARAFNRMAEELGSRAAQIAEADRMRRLLLADVSHELMTPLTAVRGFQEKLASDDAIRGSAERARYVSIIGDETHRVEHIVGDLLDLARLENAAESLNAEDVSVEGLFGRVAARHSADALDRGVTLTTEVESGAEIVHGDRFRLEQALQNLTANALRHTPSGGRIELRAESVEGYTRLLVRDTGVGIAHAHLPVRFRSLLQGRSGPQHAGGEQRPRAVYRESDRRTS